MKAVVDSSGSPDVAGTTGQDVHKRAAALRMYADKLDAIRDHNVALALLTGVSFDPLRLDEMSADDNLATFGEVLVADAGEVAPSVDVDPYASASVAGFA